MKNRILHAWLLPLLLLGNAAMTGTTLAADGPATITTPPANLTVLEGSPATFSVVADGTAPFSYQWLRGGAPISGQTGSSYTLATTTASDNNAVFSVTVSNALDGAISTTAILTVDPGVLVTSTASLINISAQNWRYFTNGTDLGTGWREPAFVDTAWPQGQAIFGVEVAGVYPEPTRTPFTAYTQAIITYYFRTHFTYTPGGGNPVGLGLNATTYIDDGAVIYLNGTEVGRARLAEGQTAVIARDQPVLKNLKSRFFQGSRCKESQQSILEDAPTEGDLFDTGVVPDPRCDVPDHSS